MSANSTEYRIRVKPVVPWPGNHHAHIICPPPPPNYEKWELVIGGPESTLGEWACGTDFVWPVIGYVTPDGEENGAENRTYVCRHQIQTGD